ncbi:MAG: T9SS type A sorting domain-containing protein [Bacteroidetes bacterium]|nr:T9SS type A sorting domain-containing protein [Bacteroidota bacterium]
MSKKTRVIIMLFVLANAGVFSQSWSGLGNCLSGYNTGKMIDYQNNLYIAGAGIASCSNMKDTGLIFFDGQKFNPVSGTEDAEIYDMTIYNDTLVLGGGFTYAGTDPWPGPNTTYHLAKWNGSNWSTGNVLGDDGFGIYAVAVYKGELYIGGNFTQINGQPFGRIAKWNGSQWTSVGGGFPLTNCNYVIDCMAVFNGELYVGGEISLPNGPNGNCYNCVRWNGAKWDSVGGQIGPGDVFALCPDTVNNKLYIGGPISYAGSNTVHTVAVWDGTTLSAPGWCPVDGAPTLAMFKNELYVGGLGFNDTILAKYNGSSWAIVDKRHNVGINALCVYNGNLYAGGSFDSIGGVAAKNIACYGSTCPQGVGVQELQVSGLKFKVYPNPAKREINIELTASPQPSPKERGFVARVKNSLGQNIFEQKFEKELKINTSDFRKGIYFVEVCDLTPNPSPGGEGRLCHTEKIVLE